MKRYNLAKNRETLMSEANTIEIIEAIMEVLSDVRKTFHIRTKEEILSLITNLTKNAKSSTKDLFTYIHDWIKKALAGKDIYGKGVIMLGRDSALTA